MEQALALQVCTYSYLLHLQQKFETTIQNKWFWLVVALILGLALIGYAAYCTYRGYRFTGNVRIHFPKVWQMSIGCTK